MVEYTQKLNVSAHDFYEVMLEEMCRDLVDRNGLNVTVKDLKNGYRFKTKKKRGKEIIDSVTEFKKPVQDKKIESHYELAGMKYLMAYEIKEIDDHTIEVTYKQDDGSGKVYALNKMAVIHTAKKRLKAIEQIIKSKK